MYRTLYCNDIRDSHVGQTVELAGWVDVVRDHGGVIFIDLRDYTGVTQVVVHNEELLKNVNRETVISVSGIVEKRDPDTVNEKIDTGYVELVADRQVINADGKDLSVFYSDFHPFLQFHIFCSVKDIDIPIYFFHRVTSFSLL